MTAPNRPTQIDNYERTFVRRIQVHPERALVYYRATAANRRPGLEIALERHGVEKYSLLIGEAFIDEHEAATAEWRRMNAAESRATAKHNPSENLRPHVPGTPRGRTSP